MLLQIERFVVANGADIDDFINKEFCHLFKGQLNTLCHYLVDTYGLQLINALYQNSSPDAACRKINMCSPGDAVCSLVKPHQLPNLTFSQSFQPIDALELDSINEISMNKSQIIPDIEKFAFKFLSTHLPDVDYDGDAFSEYLAQARGYNWRGRDCDDTDANIYPGRKVNPSDLNIDYNCNGISGVDPDTNQPWKSQLCDESNQMGFAVIGDSVGAHFEIPPQYINGSSWNSSTFDDAIPRIFDEFDLPHKSGWTGYVANAPGTPVRSLYQYLNQRNKCNFRDYQNIGINGCHAYQEVNDIFTFRRNQTLDYPVFVVLELIGNDVCSGGEYMTNAQEFSAQILRLLGYLDTVLPAGSHVLSIGLVDARILYSALHNRTHPSGVTYEEFYDYLVCLDNSPCAGWMNSNQTYRNETYTRVVELNQVYQDIVKSGQTWNNFDHAFYEFPTEEILGSWISAGKDPLVLIEPVDGFHPSQTFHAMMADFYWEALQRDHPDWIGSVNPNNDLIEQLFGDQGGY
jgi:acyloxyacyl hydrolase